MAWKFFRFQSVLIASLCAVTSLGLQAATAQSIANQLAAVQALNCHFGMLATSDWQDAGPLVKSLEVDFDLVFSNIDLEQGTAEAIARVGSSLINARYSGDSLHLMHMIDIGSLYVTSVFADEVRSGEFRAVHARIEYATSSYPEFRERPEMYAGVCVAVEP